jgi:hypothetical protein
MYHRGLNLSTGEQDLILDMIAGIDWRRSNRKWVDDANFGLWLPTKESSEPQVVIQGAGRSNAQSIIDYVRHITRLDSRLTPPQKAA